MNRKKTYTGKIISANTYSAPHTMKSHVLSFDSIDTIGRNQKGMGERGYPSGALHGEHEGPGVGPIEDV